MRKRILIVDDEKNIRLTVSQALERLDLEIDGAVNGEEALEKIRANGYELVLLDLKMPGIDGMEVLRQVREFDRKLKVLIITAHGTVENAVEAMKLGAVDFIQKPFTPDEIRQFVSQALARGEDFLRKMRFEAGKAIDKIVSKTTEENISVELEETIAQLEHEEEQLDYSQCMEQAKAAVEAYDFDTAADWAKRAVFVNTSGAEAFNFIGVIYELKNDRLTAQKYYRAAIALDPTYQPAHNNLKRSTQVRPEGKLDIGGEKKSPKGRRSLLRRKADPKK